MAALRSKAEIFSDTLVQHRGQVEKCGNSLALWTSLWVDPHLVKVSLTKWSRSRGKVRNSRERIRKSYVRNATGYDSGAMMHPYTFHRRAAVPTTGFSQF